MPALPPLPPSALSAERPLPEGVAVSGLDMGGPNVVSPDMAPTSPTLLRFLPGAFLLLVLLAGLTLSLRASKIWVRPEGMSVRAGSWQLAFGNRYDLHLPLRDPGIELWGDLDYLLGDGRPGVQIGSGGWLYTDEEFRTAPRDDEVIAAKLDYVAQVRARLAVQGTRLLVALVPAKARVYPEHLGRKRVPAVKSDDYQSFRAGLEALGVTAPDLLAAMQAGKANRAGAGDLFLHADTHWTPLGARVAARAIAGTAGQAFPGLVQGDGSFLTTTEPPQRYFGDLLAYVRLGGLQRSWGPPRDLLVTESTRRVSPARPGAPQVLLIGTSYSANLSWNFQGALESELGTDLRNASEEGKGPVVPLEAYLDSLPDALPPKLLIWELPERFLDSPVPRPAKRVNGAS